MGTTTTNERLTPEHIVGPPTAPGISDEAELLTKLLVEVRGLRSDIQALAAKVPTFRNPLGGFRR